VGASLGDLDPQGRLVFGYRIHLSACVATGLPVSWRVEPANAYEGWTMRS